MNDISTHSVRTDADSTSGDVEMQRSQQQEDGHAPHATVLEKECRSCAAYKRAATGNASPLGMFAFGITGMMLMFVTTGWINPDFRQYVACFALFFGGGAQLVAGIWAMALGQGFEATVHTSWGAFWLGWGIMWVLRLDGATWTTTSADWAAANCLFNMQWALMAAIFFLVACKCRPMVVRVAWALAALTLFLLAIGSFNVTVRTIGGYTGFACGLSFVYGGTAQIMRDLAGTRWPGV